MATSWTMFVEPPWSYRVVADQILLGVMGATSAFDLRHGPRSRR